MDSKHLRSLDSLRGLCALLVALLYLKVASHFLFVPFVQNSWLFVDFFFVLSGFVIAYSYADKLGSRDGVTRFVIRRFGRLWPLHAAVLVGVVGLECLRYAIGHSGVAGITHPPFSGAVSLRSLPANLFLVHALLPHSWATWNAQSWSISTEFFAYLLFAGLCWRLSRRALTVASAGFLAAGAMIVLLLAPSYMQTETSITEDGMVIGVSNYPLARCIFGFFTGVLTWRVWQSGRFAPRAWCEAAVVALVVAFVSTAGQTIASMAAPLVFAAAVWVFAHERGALSRLLQKAPLTRVGAWSYSIYMVHGLLFSILAKEQAATIFARLTGRTVWHEVTLDGEARAVIDLGSVWWNDGLTLVILALVLAVSAFTYRTIERPGRALFNRLAAIRLRPPGLDETGAPLLDALTAGAPGVPAEDGL